MEKHLSRIIKDALVEETPPSADAFIRAAIRRPRAHRRILWAAAAGLALAMGCGAWIFGHERAQQIAAIGDEGEVMLEIIGMASVDDVYSLDVAQL